jgi:hypothetical protein
MLKRGQSVVISFDGLNHVHVKCLDEQMIRDVWMHWFVSCRASTSTSLSLVFPPQTETLSTLVISPLVPSLIPLPEHAHTHTLMCTLMNPLCACMLNMCQRAAAM